MLLIAAPAAAQQITFVETDTTGTVSTGCSGLAMSTTHVDLQMVKGGTAGAASHTVTVAKNSTQAGITYITPANSPGSLFWPGGQTSGNEWQVNLDVTTASSSYNWVSTYICADAGGTFTTVGSHTGFSTALSTTGVKTDTITISSGVAEASTTQVYIVLGIQDTKTGDGTPSFSFTADQNILSPLVTSPTFIQPSGASGPTCSGATTCGQAAFSVTGGNELIACADAANTSAVLSISDSNGGNTYKVAVKNTIGTPDVDVGECWYVANAVSGNYSFTLSSTVSTLLQLTVGEWSYVDPSANALDCTAPGGNASSTAVDSGACNATSNHLPELAIGYASIAVGGSVTAGSGWTMRMTVASGHGYLEDQVISTAGNFDAMMTPGSSGGWMATAFSLAQYGAAPSSCPKGMLAMMGVGCG